MSHFDGGHKSKNIVLPLIFAFLLVNTAAYSQNFWQQTSGPFGGDVRALVVKANGDIFAGHNESGIYRSSDNGASWVAVNNGLTNGAVNAMVSNASGDLFAGTFGGVFLSTDNGASWTAANTNLANSRVRGLAINSAGNIFAATEGGVFLSTDNAKTWSAVNSGLTNLFVQALVINNTTGDIFAGTTTGFFLSSNSGGAWRAFNPGLPSSLPAVRALAINSLGYIFAGTNNGIYRLLSTTATWAAINAGLTNFFIPSIYVHSTGEIFAGSEGSGIFHSSDNGNNWVTANAGLGIMTVQAFARNANGNIFVGTTGGMFRSVIGGASLSWTEINNGMLAAKVSALALKSTSDIFAGTTAGRVFRSKDEGASWTLVSTGLSNDAVQSINALAISPMTGAIFAGTGNDGMYRSSNDGSTWTRINLGLAESNILSLAINASGVIFAGGASDGVARSTDNGESWQDVNAGLTNTTIRALVLNANGDLFAGTSNGIFYSKDSGDNWTAVNTGLPPRLATMALAVDTNNDVYAAQANGTVYRLPDNGNNWVLANNGLPGSLVNALTANAAGHVFAGTNLDGTYRTIDNGGNWAAVNTGLTSKIIESLAIRVDGFAFAGTGAAGVFRSVKSTTPPAVAFSTGNLNYGNVMVNSSADLTVTLTNTGFADLSIIGTAIAGANATEFSLISGGAGTLAPNASQSLVLRFSPQSTGSKSAFFILTSNAESTPDTVALAGAGVEPRVSFSNNDLLYGNVPLNSNADLTVRLTNTGTANLSISNASLVGPNANQFSIVNIGGSGTLAPNAFLDITLRFSPTSTGNKSGYFVLASNAASSPDTVTLAGTGIAPLVSFDNNSLQYGNVLVNANSDLTVRLTNTGAADLLINSTALAGANANQFSIANGGGAGTLRPNTFRDMTLRFAPTSTGNKIAYFVLTSNAASTPDTVTLTGTGITPFVSFSTDNLKYGNVVVNANSDLTVRLTNTGTANLSINGTSLAGANANQFSIVAGGAAGTLAPNAFRDITLRFSPASVGNKIAYFVLTSNAASTPDTVALTGTGITPFVSFSTDSLKYGNVVVNANSDLTVRLTNTGTANLSITGTSLAGANANQFSIVAGGAAGTLAPNAFRDITLRFTPASTGNKIAYFVLTSNAASTPDTVTLTGTGITSFVTFSTDSLKYGNVVVNANSDLTVRLTNTGTANLSINSTSLAGVNANQFSIAAGGAAGTLAPNAFRDITLRFSPASTGNKIAYFVLNSNAASTPDTVALTGTGITSFVTFSTDSLKYGNVVLNANSDLTVRLTNTGTANLSISGTSLAGANANQFSIVAGGAAGTLAPNAFRDITLRFTPASTGNKIAYFVLTSNAASTPDTVALTGVGITSVVTFSTDSLKYGNVVVNANSDLTVRLTNTGTANLSINSTSLAGANANQFSIVAGGAAGTLAPNAFRDITLRFTPASTGNKIAYFVLTSNAASTPDTVALTGTGITPFVSFSTDSLKYGNVVVNANSDLTVRLTNTGTANLSINSTSLAGVNADQFSIVAGGAAGTLAPNAFRDITLRFAPTSVGNKIAHFVLTSNAASTPDTVALTGTGITPLVSFSTDSLKYGNVVVNANSDLTVRLTNTGTANLSISGTSLAGANANQFSIVAGGAAGTLAPNAFRDLTLRFSPASVGNKAAYFVLNSNAASTPDTVALTGTGITSFVTFSTDSLKYGNVVVNANSDLTVRLTNTGTANLSINSTSLAGANADQFSIVAGGAAGTLAPNAFRDIALRFAPTSVGNKIAHFVLTSNAASTSDTVALTGTGITPLVSFSTDSLKYGNVVVNANSDLTVRLTNTGTANLSISGTSLAGANANQFSIVAGGAAGTLAPNAFRDLTLRFSPASVGNKAAYFVLNSNAASTPDTVALTGTGITSFVTFSTDSLKYGNVVVNANSDLTVRLTNTGTANLSITGTSLAGANANQFSIVAGGAAGTLAPNAFRDLTLRFAPMSVGNKIAYFILTSNAASTPDTVALTGTGITSFVTFSTDSLKYGNVVVNANSDLTVRLTNTGTANLSITGTSLAGGNANQFSIVAGGAAGTLAPNAFRDITLRFTPASTGNKIAYFVLTSNAASTPDTVALTGTGITSFVTFSTDSLKYGNVVVNANSDLTVRLTNTGTANLSITGTNLAGGNANQFSIVAGGTAGTLAPNAFRDLTLRFAPTSVGNKIAYFVLTSNAASTPDTVALTGTGITSLISFSTDSLKYGNVVVNANSDLTVRLTNTGTANLSITGTSLAGANANQFSIVAGGAAGTLAPNAFRDLTLRFAPTSVGNKIAYFVLTSNAVSTPDTVTLTGNGTNIATPLVSFSTDSLKYGNVVLNANSDLTVRLTNTGTANLSINSTSLAGANANQFSIVAGGTAGTLAPNAFRDLTLRFAPTSVGNKIAYFVLTSNAVSTPDTVTLTGNGTNIATPLVSFSTDSLKYGNVVLNANSDLTVRLTNTGTANLSINSTSLAGANANQFNIVAGGTAGTLTPNAFRDLTLRFAPTSTGNKIAYFVLTSNAASTPDTVTLIGNGAAPFLALSSDSLQYGSWAVNSSSEQTLRLTNTGAADLSISGTSLAGVDVADFSIVNGGGAGTLLPNASREVVLRFAPQSRGNKIAQLVITSNAASSPDTVMLLGNGVDSAIEQDSLALVALYNNTGGANWKNKTNWLAGSLSSWFGVTVFNNAVTAVKLDTNNLAGTLPAQIGNLTRLAYLNLGGNRLSGDVPAPMANLNALRELYLQNNRLVNLPKVTAIATLDTLFIQNNLFTFEDIEPNLTTPIDSIAYAPQDSVGSPSDTTLAGGAKLTLRVNVGGNNNQYQWLKNGAPIAGANNDSHTILVATSNDVGVYVCRITNTVAAKLTLFSRPQSLSAVIAPRFTFAPETLAFGAVRVNASFDQTVTLTNRLNIDIAIQQTTIIAKDASAFNIVNGGGAQVLPANSARTMTVRFIPKTAGDKFAALQIISNAAATLDTINLVGAGIEPLTALSNTNLNFGPVALGANSDQTVRLTNSGTADLAILFCQIAGAQAGDFSITNGGTAGILAPNASRNIALRFAPQTTGARNAALVIISDAASSPDTVLLSGTGSAPALSLSRRNVDFGNVWIGGNPVAQTVTLINAGTANLNINGVNLSGANANAFLIASGGGPGTIAPSASRDLVLQFSPQTTGTKNAVLIIASNAASIPDTVKLSGSGSELAVNVGNSGNPLVGTAVNLSVSSLGGFVPTSRFLFYRIAGETKYDSLNIVQNGSGFTADIPPSAVTLRGVEFYVRFSDGSTVVTFPALNARNKPQMIRVRIDGHPFPLALKPNTYKMISVGMDLDSTGFANVLEEYAEYDTLFWRLFRWENNRYEEYSDINAKFTPGTAFWLITRAGNGFGFNDALSTPSVQPFTITLQPGWNQIANPFAFPVAVDSLRFTGRTDTLAFWDGVEYQYNVTVLEPWEGYFINNLESTPITLTIPPVAAAKKSGKATHSRALAANEYMLQLSAQMLGTKLVDTQNFVGLLNRAQVERDALDFAEAPAIGDYVQLSIVENGEHFAGNFKPASGDGQQWVFEVRAHVRANVTKKLQISLRETGQLPEGFQRFVLDMDYGAVLPASNETFDLELNDKLSVRRFKIIVGTKAYAESNNDGVPLVPVDYVLEQNYPNPFALNAQSGAANLQTTIRYQLNKRAPVVLEIRNTLGQKVRTLVDGEQSTGSHAATWDGLDEAGRQAASGVYFYTLKTAEFTATKKLVLTR